MITAEIIDGAVSGSMQVMVSASLADATVVVVFRGGLRLGQGRLLAGQATVVVGTLAAGDIVQASVGERGNQAGIPIVVAAGDTEPTGWQQVQALMVRGDDGTQATYTAQQYTRAFGQQVGAIYDPAATGLGRILPEYQPDQAAELGFDLRITQQPGRTTLLVVARNGESLLVGYNGATPAGNAPFNVTQPGTVTITAQRGDAGELLHRSVDVPVLPAPGTVPSAGDIVAVSYRNFGNGYLRVQINSSNPCEVQLSGFSDTWVTAVARETDYLEADFLPVPAGTYTARIRPVGETNAAHYVSVLIKL